jgi:hypothetical protein
MTATMQKARFGGSTCSACGGDIAKGAYYYDDEGGTTGRHVSCPKPAPVAVEPVATVTVPSPPRGLSTTQRREWYQASAAERRDFASDFE